MIRRFVLDTSLFVNPHSRKQFGKDSKKAVKGFIKKAKGLNAEFFMPPSIFRELGTFVGSITEDLELIVKKRAPNIYAIYLPAAVFYEFVDDVRIRINKGLRLAEEFTADEKTAVSQKLGKLREKYRDAMRAGLVDSKEDFELVILAKELDAALVSADEGVIKFGNKVGCECVDAKKFGKILSALKKR
ncbi:RNA ligase partner protein [Candidatus Micrarchaeota archaeon]|nr:RNA ligase partner protein [Candidatus Micrarchaeota archaeon]